MALRDLGTYNYIYMLGGILYNSIFYCSPRYVLSTFGHSLAQPSIHVVQFIVAITSAHDMPWEWASLLLSLSSFLLAKLS